MGSVFSVFAKGTVISKGSSEANFWPLGNWIPAAEVAFVRATLEMRSTSTNCEVSAAYQTANDISAVSGGLDGFQLVGSYLTDEGILYPTQWDDISSSTRAKTWIRFGVAVRSKTGASFEPAYVRLKVEATVFSRG